MTYAIGTLTRPWTLAHRPEAAGQARTIALELLTRWGVSEEMAGSVLLTVSELVTNSVQHAQPPLSFGLDCDPADGHVHVEVADGGPAATEADRTVDLPADEHGRGLLIIDCLADAHGECQEAGHAVHWVDITALP
ncbi:ATP-binding protein [Streptomyces sp. NPDC058475]|uniref:ATP-binding protein n=1 Tax=unclassified Streptomyces TaxID=2593676 RepID=UPI003651A097